MLVDLNAVGMGYIHLANQASGMDTLGAIYSGKTDFARSLPDLAA